MNTKPKIFSFFSGSGFLDLGFELNGFNIVYVNEIDPSFIEAYKFSRKFLKINEPEYGYYNEDITTLFETEKFRKLKTLLDNIHQNSNLVGFIGSPPCPDFSIAGKNQGIKGNNGKLSEIYIDLICQQKPDFFLFENVKGLYKTKKHRVFFELLKSKLNQAGYILTEKLINALEYGVPQDRERIILIGFTQDLIANLEINFNENILTEDIFPWEQSILYPKDVIFSYPWLSKTKFKENSLFPFPNNIPRELTVEYWFRKNDVLNHPNAQHYFKPRAGVNKMASVDEGDDSKKSYKRLHRWRYSPTACYGNNEVHLHPYQIRRISVAEALAIQSLPKTFYLPDTMSLTAMLKTIGNGVPYLAAKAISQTILEFLNQKNKNHFSSFNKQLELPLIYSKKS